jgi:hypothetical protein
MLHVIKMREGMRSIRRTSRGPCVLPKTQRNSEVLFRTHFTTIWGSKIRISIKVDADAPECYVISQKTQACRTKHIDSATG